MIWFGLFLIVAALVAADLGIFHRRARVVGAREALAWTGVWVGLSLAFAVFIFFAYQNGWAGAGRRPDAVDGLINGGRLAATKYLIAYALEKSLSVDNIFVLYLLFESLRVPPERRYRALIWGVIGAIVMRGALIAAGVSLIVRYHWLLYAFGVFLIVVAARMLTGGDGRSRASRGAAARAAAAAAPFLPPLVAAVIVIEVADLIFALDSIPAVFTVTADPFLVLASNIFAVLGLRSLYFVLAGTVDRFRYLRRSLAAVLAVVGAKMLLANWLARVLGREMNLCLLAVVLWILGAGILASWRPVFRVGRAR